MPPPSATTPTSSSSASADESNDLLWTQADLKPLGQPVAVGKDVAVYAEKGTVLYIEVVDAATGRLLWSKLASPGGVALGVGIKPSVVGGMVAYLRPSAGSMFSVQIVSANAESGKDEAVSATTFHIADRVSDCSGQACFTASTSSGQTGLRMDVHTGNVTQDPARSDLSGREIASDGLLSIQNDGEPEQLARRVGANILWTTPLSDVYGPGHSTNWGWDFQSFDKRNLIVGTVGRIPADVHRTSVPLGSGTEMAGINLSTGVRTWLQTGGLDYYCATFPPIVGNDPLSAVRCRWGKSATMILNQADGTNTLKAATVSLEGFDPGTGKTTWTVPLADATGLSYWEWQKSIKIAGQQTLVVEGVHGLTTVDPVTGATAPAAATTRVTCIEGIGTAIAGAGLTYDGKFHNMYSTGVSMYPCLADGTSVAMQGSWPTWAGVVAAHVRVVTTPTGLQGYRT